jgi:stage II sporulation protein GA (sporulation sigma-E factor processing peptidase)
MVVYVDILLFLSIVLDLLIISLTAKFTRSNPKLKRKILASLVSSLFSLYIFLPKQSFIIELLLRLLSSVIPVLICFGFKSLKSFCFKVFVFYCISFIYAGFMMGIWLLFKPESMSINNGVVYFNISPLILLTVSFVLYLAITLIRSFVKPDANLATRSDVELKFLDKTVFTKAMIDSGHSLENIFGDGIIIIIDFDICEDLIGSSQATSVLCFNVSQGTEIAKRFRVVPIKTVSGENLMPAIKLDSLIIKTSGAIKIDKPLAVISKEKLGDDYSVILPPEATINF